VRLQVLTAESMKVTVFWDTVTFSHRPDDGGSKHLWNFCKFLLDYTVQHSRRQPSSYTMFFQNINFWTVTTNRYCWWVYVCLLNQRTRSATYLEMYPMSFVAWSSSTSPWTGKKTYKYHQNVLVRLYHESLTSNGIAVPDDRNFFRETNMPAIRISEVEHQCHYEVTFFININFRKMRNLW
jgi:hypothetical protein